MNNLYTFSKTSWHVKLFKWIYNADPTQEFKTMCPYFWTYVFTFLFFPLILAVKLFGKAGTNLLNYFREYNERKEKAQIEELKKLISNPNLTPEEAYNIYNSKCFRLNEWGIMDDWEQYTRLKILSNKHISEVVFPLQQEKYDKKEEFKNSTVFNSISVGVSLALLVVFIKLMWWFVPYSYNNVDWERFGKITLIFGGGCFIGIIIVYFIKFLTVSLKFSCSPKMKKSLNIFSTIGKGFTLIFDMLYATYKRYCPIITWK